MLDRPPWMQRSATEQAFGFRVKPQKQRLACTHCRRGVQRNVGLYRTSENPSRSF